MRPQRVKAVRRRRRKARVRKRIFGVAEVPRLSVSRSLKNISAQLIDDERGVTLCQACTRDKALRPGIKYGGNIDAARAVGSALAERARAQGIVQARFDRNGYRFHGRIRALADAAREGGMKF